MKGVAERAAAGMDEGGIPGVVQYELLSSVRMISRGLLQPRGAWPSAECPYLGIVSFLCARARSLFHCFQVARMSHVANLGINQSCIFCDARTGRRGGVRGIGLKPLFTNTTPSRSWFWVKLLGIGWDLWMGEPRLRPVWLLRRTVQWHRE